MTDEPQQEQEEKFSEKEKRSWAELEDAERTGLQANNGHVEGKLTLAKQDQSELAAKREVLVQAETCGPGFSNRYLAETKQQPGESVREVTMPEPEAQSCKNTANLLYTRQSQPAQSELCQKENMNLDLQPDSAAGTIPQHVEWIELPFNDGWSKVVSQAQSKDRDKFRLYVKLDRQAAILDIRLGRLDGQI